MLQKRQLVTPSVTGVSKMEGEEDERDDSKNEKTVQTLHRVCLEIGLRAPNDGPPNPCQACMDYMTDAFLNPEDHHDEELVLQEIHPLERDGSASVFFCRNE